MYYGDGEIDTFFNFLVPSVIHLFFLVSQRLNKGSERE